MFYLCLSITIVDATNSNSGNNNKTGLRVHRSVQSNIANDLCAASCTGQNRECRDGQCVCQDGFFSSQSSSSSSCEDMNECLDGICGELDCFNTVGSYLCVQSLPGQPSAIGDASSNIVNTMDPTSNPTSNPTNSPSLTAAPSVRPRFCDDSLYDQFTLDGDAGTQRCVWLTSRPDEQEIYCQPGRDAYDICAETCGKCTDDCVDTDGQFPTVKEINGVNQTIFRDCLWLSLRTSVIQEVCRPGFTAYDITCPETCGSCDVAAPVAPVSPTIAPIMDTVPSSSPSIRVNCDDVPFGKFPLIDDGGEQVCVWLAAADRQAQRDIYCVPGQIAYDVCEETCGKCNDDNYCVDTNDRFLYLNSRTNQTESHDCLWLSLRPPVQVTECIRGKTINDITCPETCNSCDAPELPTLFPTTMAPVTATTSPTMPSPMPTHNDCVDTDRVFFFDGEERDCAWLAVEPVVQAQVCVRGFTAYDSTCPATCGACEVACMDSDGTFFFETIARDCAWLAANTTVQDQICFPGFTAYDITCHATCSQCELLSLAPSELPTTLPPTTRPTLFPSLSPSMSFPSMVPSESPAFANCFDIPDGTWYYFATESVHTCDWLANASQLIRDSVCRKGFTVYDVVCKRTCRNCP